MIKTHSEYQNALQRLAKDRDVLAAEERSYRERKLNDEQVRRALEPHLSFHEQLKDEVAWYESVRRGDFNRVESLEEIGKLLIAARIMSGLSQRELAERLGVNESQVSRDERNEYYGVTARRASEILGELGANYSVTMQPLAFEPEPQAPKAAVVA